MSTQLPYTDGLEIQPKVVTFQHIESISEPIAMQATMSGQVIVRVGGKEAIANAQDILNAARFFGAKDIDARIK